MRMQTLRMINANFLAVTALLFVVILPFTKEELSLPMYYIRPVKFNNAGISMMKIFSVLL